MITGGRKKIADGRKVCETVWKSFQTVFPTAKVFTQKQKTLWELFELSC
jgi:hypothetical protein